MAKTKISIRKKREFLRIMSVGFSALAFLLIFFELVVALHGGWDDLNYTAIFVAPIAALLSLIAALLNIVKFRAKGREVAPTLAAVALSALFFCFVMVYTSAVTLARL